MARVISLPLAVERLDNGKRRLLRELAVELRDGSVLRVPKGFITDYSSFPWFSRWIVRWSKVDIAGVIHDFLYQRNGITREMADAIWKEVAESGKKSANKVQSTLSWVGLRLGGWWRWNKYRRNER